MQHTKSRPTTMLQLLAMLLAMSWSVGCIMPMEKYPDQSSTDNQDGDSFIPMTSEPEEIAVDAADLGVPLDGEIPVSGNDDGRENDLDDQEPCADGMRCPGVKWPGWELEDFQPNSSRFEETYGLDAFEGRVTMVSLLASWCGYCRSQALYLEKLHQELRAEGYDIQFLTINKTNGADPNYQRALIHVLDDEGELTYDDDGEPIYRCTFPLFQDVEEVEAWELHEGGKDDFYIYGTDGRLVTYLPHGGLISTRLSTEEGYNNLKQAVLNARDVAE